MFTAFRNQLKQTKEALSYQKNLANIEIKTKLSVNTVQQIYILERDWPREPSNP